jgi:hypothetical protein
VLITFDTFFPMPDRHLTESAPAGVAAINAAAPVASTAAHRSGTPDLDVIIRLLLRAVSGAAVTPAGSVETGTLLVMLSSIPTDCDEWM